MSNKNKLSYCNNIIKGYFDKNRGKIYDLNKYELNYLLSICYLKDYTMASCGKLSLETTLRDEIFNRITSNYNSSQVLKFITKSKSFSDYIGQSGENYYGSFLCNVSEISLDFKITEKEIFRALDLLESQNYIKYFDVNGVENIIECLVNQDRIIKNIKIIKEEI